jgi:hypothetical protein
MAHVQLVQLHQRLVAFFHRALHVVHKGLGRVRTPAAPLDKGQRGHGAVGAQSSHKVMEASLVKVNEPSVNRFNVVVDCKMDSKACVSAVTSSAESLESPSR